ncbi:MULTISPECIES: TrlF family AAA-like ATPase [Achromobacter]|nr:DNA repair ATPase [Achromobacter xylosoxidans]
MTKPSTPEGSVWRLWDFHCHTPASYKWKGRKLRGLAGSERDQLIAQTVSAMSRAAPDVFVTMDYWTFDGYLTIVEYARAHPEALAGKVIFPGIELRVESSLKQRLNVHLVLDPEVSQQTLKDVLAVLKINLRGGDRSLSEECLVQHSRELGADRLARGSFDGRKVATDDEYALEVGWETAMVTQESLREALKVIGDKGLLLMPWDTYGGLSDIDWVAHYAEVRRFRTAADIFECKDEGNRLAFHGLKTKLNEKYFDSFWDSLDKKERLCVRGTDAHSFSDYGVFPSNMKTWIKSEPTFQGLRHAIKEPLFRSYIGDVPPKKAFVDANGRLFMHRLQIATKPGVKTDEKWFSGTDLKLNPDLVAIIGNKGSGKSGLAEVLALAGNSKAHDFFTFLVDDRFKSGSGHRASAFEAKLTWRNGDIGQATLNQQAKADQPERVKYISQTYFEDLCNDHITGKSDRFSTEIRKVLFSHLDQADRGRHQSLDDYLAAKEQPAQERIEGLRQTLHKVNAQLAELERLSGTAHENELKERLASKKLELGDLLAKRPAEVVKPVDANATAAPTTESQRLAAIAKELAQLEVATTAADAARRERVERRTTLSSVAQRVSALERQATKTNEELVAELQKVNVTVQHVLKVETQRAAIQDVLSTTETELGQLAIEQSDRVAKQQSLDAERTLLQEQLDQPNKLYQEYTIQLTAWDKAVKALIGTADEAETIAFYEARLAELAQLPGRCKVLEDEQDKFVKEIHAELMAIAKSRRPLFAVVEDLVAGVPGVATELKVEFQSGLFFDRQAFVERFFTLVKQNTGGFRGDDEGPAKLMALLRGIDFDDAESLAKGLRKIRAAITVGADLPGPALLPILRTKVTAEQLYEQLFDLKQVEAKFSLSLAGTTIQQMSPGQRGALLLIFYLLVDTDPTPLILDQPEENLDNQTVYSMLVPIIKRAKERRQIVMVTHNANLAVCCDAEQIIHAEFDRGDQFALAYASGAIESSKLNRSVLDVLEGTIPAFDNRREKYFH